MSETHPLSRRLVGEALGTGLLVATVVGSGIMAQSLSTDVAIQLLGNTLPTGAMLVVLITIFGPLSGAHFNPAVSAMFAMRGDLARHELLAYAAAQVLGGICGTLAAHLMFSLDLWQVSDNVRTGGPQWFAEIIATLGLAGTILGGLRFSPGAIPWLVGLYITAAYWFTASTSFANPAVTIARALTDTFSGIRPLDLPGFILAQMTGMVAGLWLFSWLFDGRKRQAG